MVISHEECQSHWINLRALLLHLGIQWVFKMMYLNDCQRMKVLFIPPVVVE